MKLIILMCFGVVQAYQLDMNGIPFNLPGYRYCSSCNITKLSSKVQPLDNLDVGCKNYNIYLKEGYDEYKMMKDLLDDVWKFNENRKLNLYWMFYSAARAKIIFESTYLTRYSLRVFIRHNPVPKADNCLVIDSEGVGFEAMKTKKPLNYQSWRIDSVSKGESYEKAWTQGIESLWAFKTCNRTFHKDFVVSSYKFLSKMATSNKKMREDTLWNDYWHYWTSKSYHGHVEKTDISRTTLPTCDANGESKQTLRIDWQSTNLIRQSNPSTPIPMVSDTDADNVTPSSSKSKQKTLTVISPFGDNCHIIINEVSSPLPNVSGRKEFIELKRVCSFALDKQQRRMLRVKLVIVNMKTKNMVTTVNLHNENFPQHNDFFVIHGTESFVKASKLEQDTHVFIPQGTEEPHVIFLLYKKDKDEVLSSEVYSATSFRAGTGNPKRRDIFKPFEVKVGENKLNTKLVDIIKHTVIDAVAYGAPINEDFSYLQDISPAFEGCNFILYDQDKSKTNEQTYTINQCQESSKKVAFQFKYFKRGLPTPGETNDCYLPEFILDTMRHVVSQDEIAETVGLTETPTRKGECPFSDPISAEIFEEIQKEEHYIRKYLKPDYHSTLDHILDYSNTVWKYIKENNMNLEQCTVAERLFPYEIVVAHTIPVETRLRCKVCNTRLHKCPNTLHKNRVDNKMRDDGFYVTNTNTFRTGLNRHIRKQQHLESLLQSVRKDRIILQAEHNQKNYLQESPFRLKALTNLIRAVYTLTLSNTTPYSFPKLIDLLRITDAHIGQTMHSRQTAMRIMKFISDAMHQTLVDYLVKFKPPVSILLDGSSDKQDHHYILVYLQTTEGTRTIVYFYKLLTLGKSSTAQSYLDVLTAAFKKDGVSFVDYIKEKATSVITDGAANMRKFQDIFDTWVGRYNAEGNLIPLYGIYCTSHKLQLISRNSVIPGKLDANLGPNNEILYLAEFERKLNEFFTFFKSASRRIGEFRDVHVEFNFPRVELTYLYTNRWISAEFRTIKNFLGAYKTLEKTLSRISDEQQKEYTTQVKNKAKSLRNDLLDKRFLLILKFMQDYTAVFQKWSLGLQTRAGLLISQYESMTKLENELVELSEFKGDYLEEFLKSVKCSGSKNIETIGCTLEEYEASESIVWNDLSFTINKADETMVDFRILVKVLIEKTKNKFEFYVPKKAITTLRIFNPTNFPASIEALKLHKVGSTTRGELIFLYGEKEILDICTKLGIGNRQVVLQHWGKLVKSIVLSSNWDIYRSKPDPAHFWSSLLKDKKLRWEPETEELIRKVLTLANGSIICETGFSLFNIIKNQRRTRLNDDNLEGFLRLASNGPRSIDMFDAYRYARLWVDHGGNVPDETSTFSRLDTTISDSSSSDYCEEPDQHDETNDFEISDVMNVSIPPDEKDESDAGSVIGSDLGMYINVDEEEQISSDHFDNENPSESTTKKPNPYRSFLY